MFDERVVIHFQTGRTLSGWGDNFLPTEEEILVKDQDDVIQRVALRDVKIICFVKAFATDSRATHLPPAKILYQAVHGRKVRLQFKDGEKLEGVASLNERPLRGFFVTPLNPNSNNIAIYVNPNFLKSFEFLG
jgi:hypothetical protein